MKKFLLLCTIKKEIEINRLDIVFAALADPTRRRIVEELRMSDRTVVELSKLFDMSLPAVSKHLKILNNAGLLDKQKDGKFIVCSYSPKPFKEAMRWIGEQYDFWNEGFDSLEKFLDGDSTPKLT